MPHDGICVDALEFFEALHEADDDVTCFCEGELLCCVRQLSFVVLCCVLSAKLKLHAVAQRGPPEGQ